MNIYPNANRSPLIVGLAALIIGGLLVWLLGPWNSLAASGLVGKTWQLTAVNGQPAVPGSNATLLFEKDRLGGNASVNTFGGNYKVSANTITVSDLVSTMMASADPALNQQEQSFLGVLQGQVSYKISGNQLELRSAAGTLTFTS